MRHIWSVLADKAVVDRTSNNISILEVIEQFNLSLAADAEFPLSLPYRGEVVSLWMRSDPENPETGIARLRLLAPDGTQLAVQEREVDLSNSSRLRSRATFDQIAFGGAGWHEMEVAFREDEGGEWTVGARLPFQVFVAVAGDDDAE